MLIERGGSCRALVRSRRQHSRAYTQGEAWDSGVRGRPVCCRSRWVYRQRVRPRRLPPKTEAAAEGEDGLSQGGAAMALRLRVAGEGSRRRPGLFSFVCGSE